MVLKSGTERVAVHVDEVQGNREVVVKNIGPQLARMAGIAGATVLGSGDIVLILNPVVLAHQGGHHALAAAVAAPVNADALSRKAVVMVVDDSLTVRKVTQRLLEREGYQVVLAKDGVDALEHLQEIRPDLMLVDIEMPRMDGFDLTRNIRGNEGTQSVPIIMITSRTADKHRNYALGLGVNAYFGKPFQEDALLAAITGLLKRELKAG
jgi:chemosensory pili system protein ChpA (sensor histidine kinase/response regulator)